MEDVGPDLIADLAWDAEERACPLLVVGWWRWCTGVTMRCASQCVGYILNSELQLCGCTLERSIIDSHIAQARALDIIIGRRRTLRGIDAKHCDTILCELKFREGRVA